MAKSKEKIHVQVYVSDRNRLKKIADKEKRTMLVMFSMVLDKWEGKE